MELEQSLTMSNLSVKDMSSKPTYNPDLLGFHEAMKHQKPNRRRRRSSNFSDIYKNPQAYAGLRQTSSDAKWSVVKKCLFLSPAFAFQFCTVLASVFSRVNLRVLEIPTSCLSVHLLLTSVLSIGMILTFQKLVRKFYCEDKHLAILLVGFSAYLCLGTTLVLVFCVERMSNPDELYRNVSGNVAFIPNPDMRILESGEISNRSFTGHSAFPGFKTYYSSQNKSTSFGFYYNAQSKSDSPGIQTYGNSPNQSDFHRNLTYENYQNKNDSLNASKNVANMLLFASSEDNVTYTENIAKGGVFNSADSNILQVTQILAYFGYLILASSLSSGQYLLTSIALSVMHVDDHNSITTIKIAATAFGGCSMSLLGAADYSFKWHPSNENSSLLIGQILILLCIAIVLLIGCTSCSVITWYSDRILEKYQFRSRHTDELSSLLAQDRRPTRTAQEIFDECRALLGNRALSSSYMDENFSQRNMPKDYDEGLSTSISHSETVFDNSELSIGQNLSEPYPYQLLVPVRGGTPSMSWLQLLRSQKKFSLALALMFFLCSCLLSIEFHSSTYLTYVLHNRNDSWLDTSYRKGTRIGSAGTFMTYMIFIGVYYFYYTFTEKTGWKIFAIVMSLVTTVLTLVMAVTEELSAYFAAACSLGLLRLVVVRLPDLLVGKTQVGFQTSPVNQIRMETPTTLLWCMMPLSLGVSSVVITPLTDINNWYTSAVYFAAGSAMFGCVILKLLS